MGDPGGEPARGSERSEGEWHDERRLELLNRIRSLYSGPAADGDEGALRIVRAVDEMIAETERLDR